MWDGIRELAEEVDLELLEARSNDPMHKVFQISAKPTERETMKVGKRDGCRVQSTREVPLRIMVMNRAREDNPEGLQLGHE